MTLHPWTPPCRRPRRFNAGHEWFQSNHKADLNGREITPQAAWVLDMLGEWAGGIYNFHGKLIWNTKKDGRDRYFDAELARMNPTAAQWLTRNNFSVLVSDDMATFDSAQLTRLVFLSHDWSVRVDVRPYSFRYTEIHLSVRERTERADPQFMRHPRLVEAYEFWRRQRHRWL